MTEILKDCSVQPEFTEGFACPHMKGCAELTEDRCLLAEGRALDERMKGLITREVRATHTGKILQELLFQRCHTPALHFTVHSR